MSPAVALMYVRHLGYDSAFIAEMRGGQRFRGWDEDRYLSAALVNSLRTLIFVTIMANSDPKKSRHFKPPEMWPLPDEIKKVDPPGSFAFIAKAHIAAAKKRKALADASR